MGGIETLPWLILLREMTVKVAISYRRDDSAAITGRIFDRLSARLGRESVFRDIDSIPVGENFEKKIEYVLSQCLVFIAVVGPDWCGRQRRTYRIKQGDDFVRMEVETALARGIAIIPVLVEGASMPKRAQLPNSLQNFPLLNALRIDSGRDFDHHISELFDCIQKFLQRHGLAEAEMRPTAAAASSALYRLAEELPRMSPFEGALAFPASLSSPPAAPPDPPQVPAGNSPAAMVPPPPGGLIVAATAGIKLPARIPFILGVTGHGDLRAENRPQLEAEVAMVLDRLKCDYISDDSETPILLLSSLAKEADQLVARLALARGIQVIGILPMPLDEYRRDFNPAALLQFEELLSQATGVIVLPMVAGNSMDTIHLDLAKRRQQYRAAGIFIARHCHILLALWDGAESEISVGGPAEIVSFKRRGVPIDITGSARATLDTSDIGPVIHIVTPHSSVHSAATHVAVPPGARRSLVVAATISLPCRPMSRRKSISGPTLSR
jgi:hypothetical protein